ncbi:hypothetical protein BS50DRAFT_506112 [Corynespora cassiicola Philippines]|uniref:Uncharacterized protein n=1 Tax=Corynespora cassiicola Philippines TaxID=1448308 RepID=A0A2T2N520_CORCC|nr:hypothetical protein BS50DRAFT_506112 [Corynespora cassiicola Philippines]
MTTYTPPQYFFQEQQPQLFISSDTLGYGQYDPQRSKTPTSLINHTGLSPGGPSPGPLSTPPPLSRTDSLPPDQPEHMLYDDQANSLSNSPTSVRTPDNENLEDMLDNDSMRNYYPQNPHVAMSTQATHNPVPTMALNMYPSSQDAFPDEAIDDAVTASIASTQLSYPQHYNVQLPTTQNMLAAQPFNTSYSQNYTAQPSRQDPWTGQGPPRQASIPRSGQVLFDPMSDPSIDQYAPFGNVDSWRMNSTDPNDLTSPNEAMAPPQDGFYDLSTQNYGHNHSSTFSQNQAPLNAMTLRLTVPATNFNGQNYMIYQEPMMFSPETFSAHMRPQTYFTGLSPTESHVPSVSPASAPSPGGSDDLSSSYQISEPGVVLDPQQHEHHAPRLQAPPSPVTFQPSPTLTIAEVTFDASPEPEAQHPVQPTRRKPGSNKLGRPGGRTLGTHLDPKVAKSAHDMRKIVACWHCVLQRDKCGPGDICERCNKRSMRPNADCGLGCSRIKLIELSSAFLPSLVMQIHEDSHLTHFVNQHIHQWTSAELTVYLTCGQDHMPRIPVKVYEFIPRGNELLVQIQYGTDPVTHERISVQKESPALGMVHINPNEERAYDRYINDIVDGHLDAFGELCWMEDDNDFQQKLFKLMTRVKTKSEDEAKLLREVFRLLVVTFIMGHTMTIAEESKYQTLSKMHQFTSMDKFASNFISPRMANRQLKYFFNRLHRSIMAAVLNKLQQIFKSSKGCDKWLPAFVAVVGMCMAHEEQQKTVHVVMSTRAKGEGFDPRDAQAQADIACREIDVRMGFIIQIFRWKYNRKCNPLRDAEHEWDKEIGFGDASSVAFVRQVAQLVKENIDFMQKRRCVSISPANQTKYTSRLVSEFLLSFWLPQ